MEFSKKKHPRVGSDPGGWRRYYRNLLRVFFALKQTGKLTPSDRALIVEQRNIARQVITNTSEIETRGGLLLPASCSRGAQLVWYKLVEPNKIPVE